MAEVSYLLLLASETSDSGAGRREANQQSQPSAVTWGDQFYAQEVVR